MKKEGWVRIHFSNTAISFSDAVVFLFYYYPDFFALWFYRLFIYDPDYCPKTNLEDS